MAASFCKDLSKLTGLLLVLLVTGKFDDFDEKKLDDLVRDRASCLSVRRTLTNFPLFLSMTSTHVRQSYEIY